MPDSGQRNPGHMQPDNRVRKSWLFIVVSMLVGLSLLGYKTYTTLLPAAAEYIAEKIPAEIYQIIGESTLEDLDAGEFAPSELAEEQQNKVTEQFNQLLSEIEFKPDELSLHFRQWDQHINAITLMDGSIVITDELVNTLNERQLNGVLLHEIAHIHYNHLMEKTVQSSLFYVMISMLLGDTGLMGDLLIESSALGYNLTYSRTLEQQADAFAASKLIALYGTAEPMLGVLKLLSEQQKPQYQWLSTHPSYSQREKTFGGITP
ncbi:M48 family metallopeptidase [Lacimicrobium alkaliphilum]|uniref:Peptidase M48 domain-containing protein n=1 Tax=Lacimicrobium alkaliphilum TaxID=1526571 RepID=A0ABQ1RI58_9ALTE|nr:M48 family metallopeptidase [Lacimicrobium alkaliphilum]GGD71249.1 hypothetical protein GCM10011357_27960 [Lacimicrobium alkaliphilum]